MRLDILFIKFCLDMILGEDLNDVALFCGLGGGDRFKPVPKSELIIFTPLSLGDDDIEATLSEVLGLGMTLAPITDDSNLFPFQVIEICVLVIIDFHLLFLSSV